MMHKFYETLHTAEEFSFETNCSNGEHPSEDEMVVLNKILKSLESFVRDVFSLDGEGETREREKSPRLCEGQGEGIEKRGSG